MRIATVAVESPIDIALLTAAARYTDRVLGGVRRALTIVVIGRGHVERTRTHKAGGRVGVLDRDEEARRPASSTTTNESTSLEGKNREKSRRWPVS